MTVKQARAVAGLTQAKMAEKLHIHRSTYFKLEKEPTKFTVEQAKEISEITGVPIDDIFFN
jgi:DNA-binding XRE family transcriptional regulator